MKLQRLDQVVGTERDVKAQNWNSRRLLLKDDGMGFSLHDTIIYPGTSTAMWYQHHLEAVYCIAGKGEIKVLDSGEVCQIGPGTVYALNDHERHILTAHTEMRMVCVFNPPLTGRETHDQNGAYPIE